MSKNEIKIGVYFNIKRRVSAQHFQINQGGSIHTDADQQLSRLFAEGGFVKNHYIFSSKRFLFLILIVFGAACVGPAATYADSAAAEKTTDGHTILRIAQIDWCPEICPGGKRKGYLVDILEEAFAGSEFQLKYTTYPWSRGLAATRGGSDIAIIAPAKKEAPGLLFSAYPVGSQRACFYTRGESSWTFTGAESLKGMQIGVPSDMSLEGLNEYMRQNRHQFHFQSITDKYLVLSINMLVSKRIGVFSFTENAVLYQLVRDGLEAKVRQAGCLPKVPIYLAFTPVERYADVRERAMKLFDLRMRAMVESGRINEIRQQYNLPPEDYKPSF